MQQHTLKPRPGSTKRGRRRGIGDTFAGRGVKGQQSRVGGRSKFTAGFEGGQIPLVRRMPKLGGFRSPNRVENQPVNLKDIETRFTGDTVNIETLHAAGLIQKKNLPVKILGGGEFKKKLSFTVNFVSASAKSSIEKAGGTITLTSEPKESAKQKADKRLARKAKKLEKSGKKS